MQTPIRHRSEFTIQGVPAGRTMLIVDDEALIRWALRQQFERAFRIVEAGTVAEATELIQACGQALGVTLLDLQMPDGIGLVLLDLLRVHSPECVAIVITACADETLLASAQASGARAVLAKPVEMPMLLRTLSTIHE